jgi:hypothetical protein
MSSSTFILRTLITKSSSRLLHSSIDYTRQSTILNSKLSSTLHLRSSLRKRSSERTNKVFVEFDEISSNLMNLHRVWWDIVHQNLMKHNYQTWYQVWWDLTRYISSSLMRCCLSEMMKCRSYQVWWIVFVTFDESFSSKHSLSRKNSNQTVEHKRWNDQAWLKKRIHRNISARKISEVAFFDHISHFETKRNKSSY